MIGYVILALAACVMLPFTVWHYAGYWNGRYDPPPTPEPLTPCPDTGTVSETSHTPRKDHDS